MNNILTRTPLYKVDQRIIGMIATMLHPNPVERPNIRECYNLVLACYREVANQQTGGLVSSVLGADKGATLGIPSPAKTGQGFLFKASLNSNTGKEGLEHNLKNQTSLKSPGKQPRKMLFGNSPKSGLNRYKDLFLKLEPENREDEMESVSSNISGPSVPISPTIRKDTLVEIMSLKQETPSMHNLLPTGKSKLYSERKVNATPLKLAQSSSSVKLILTARRPSLKPVQPEKEDTSERRAVSNSNTPRVILSGRDQFKPSNQLSRVVLFPSGGLNYSAASGAQSKQMFSFANCLTPQSSPLKPKKMKEYHTNLDNSCYLQSHKRYINRQTDAKSEANRSASGKISSRLSLSIHKHRQLEIPDFEVDVKVRVSANRDFLQQNRNAAAQPQKHLKIITRSQNVSMADDCQNTPSFPKGMGRKRASEATTRIFVALSGLEGNRSVHPPK